MRVPTTFHPKRRRDGLFTRAWSAHLGLQPLPPDRRGRFTLSDFLKARASREAEKEKAGVYAQDIEVVRLFNNVFRT